MTKYKVVMHYPDGEDDEYDETFDSYEEAEDHGRYLSSCYDLGGEILNMSNPGDYPYDENDEGASYEVIEG